MSRSRYVEFDVRRWRDGEVESYRVRGSGQWCTIAMQSGAGILPGSSDGSSLSVTKFSGSISFLTDLKVLSISNNQLLYVNEVIAECCTQLEEVAALSFLFLESFFLSCLLSLS
jgi:hypothetical protein